MKTDYGKETIGDEILSLGNKIAICCMIATLNYKNKLHFSTIFQNIYYRVSDYHGQLLS